MADVQLEHGYTQIANELLEATVRIRMPGRHKDVFLAIVRLLYGWQKKRDRIAIQQVSDIVGMEDREVRRALGDLVSWNMLTRSDVGPGRISMWGVQKDFDLWNVTSTAAAKRRRDRQPRVREPRVREPPVVNNPRVREPPTPGEGTPETPGEGPRDQRKKERTKERHSASPAPGDLFDELTPTRADADISRMVNLIAKLEGEKDEKLAWLESGIGDEILGSADSELPDDATPRQRSGRIKQIINARWRTYLKNDRPYRDVAARKQLRADLEAKRARDQAEPAPELTHDPNVRRLFDE